MIESNQFMRTPTILLTAAFVAAFSTINLRAGDPPEAWTKNCASCHGKDGRGDTKAGKKADVKDLTDAKYQASFTDEQMFKQIKEGLKDGAKEKMKPFKDKLTDDEVKAVGAYVRTLKK